MNGPQTIADVGSLIRRHRRFRGFNQRELATAAGLAPGTLSRIERGDSAPRLDHLLAIAAALACPMAELLQPALKAAA